MSLGFFLQKLFMLSSVKLTYCSLIVEIIGNKSQANTIQCGKVILMFRGLWQLNHSPVQETLEDLCGS